MTPNFYNDNADILARQYLSKSFEEVYKSWSQFLPSIIENPNVRILYLVTGAGRDLKHLAELAAKTHKTENNIKILAAAPAKELCTIGQKTTQNLDVKWIPDSLPALKKRYFQLITQSMICLTAWLFSMAGSERCNTCKQGEI